jgi:MFS family permease
MLLVDRGTRPRTVWDNRDFRLFWSGRAVSITGSALTQVALPLLATLTLQATPLQLGILEACIWLPFLGLPLLAGVYVDRHRTRPIQLVCDIVQATALAGVSALAVTGRLTMPVLAGATLASAMATVFSQVGEVAYVPALVGRERVLSANSSLMAAHSGAQMGGRGVAGLLVQLFCAPAVLLLDAVSFMISAITLSAIRRPERSVDRPADRKIGKEIREGLAFVWKTTVVRVMTLHGLLFNGLWQMFTVPFIFYVIKDMRISAGWWGLVLGIGGGASMLGAILAPRLAGRFTYGRIIVVTAALGHTPLVLVPAIDRPWWTAVTLWGLLFACSGLASGVINVMVATKRVDLTPDPMLGRVGASVRLLLFAGMPLGALAGGVLAATLGNRVSLSLAVAALAATTVVLLPLWRVSDRAITPVPRQADGDCQTAVLDRSG